MKKFHHLYYMYLYLFFFFFFVELSIHRLGQDIGPVLFFEMVKNNNNTVTFKVCIF